LFERLKEKLQLNIDQIIKTIRSPTEKTVKDLLWDVISKLWTTTSPKQVSNHKAAVGFKGFYTVLDPEIR
jgi:hypothetical protein